MRAKHWTILGACLMSIAGFVTTLESWDKALEPAFIGASMLAIGSTLAGIHAQKPGLHEKWPTDWPSPPPSGPKYGKRVG